jgi:tryptophanyl-tRNA synthetase
MECRSAGIGCVACKKMMAENLINALAPAKKKRAELDSHPDMVREIMENGNKRASSIAQATMAEVKAAIGI